MITIEGMKRIYVIKSINKDMTSQHDPEFKYPKKGWVEAKNWQNSKKCGGGLHGFLWGEGDGRLGSFSAESIWLLIKVKVSDGLVVMGDKCKFRRGYVVATGDYKTIADKLQKLLPKDKIYKVIAGTATAGDYGTATAGYKGTATAGYRGTAAACDYGIATAGDEGTATAGSYGTATAGNYGTATAACDCGIATAGNYGTATAGDYGIAVAGNYGIATAGNRGIATAGDYGIATAGDYGIATAGDGGVISIGYYDEIKEKWRKKMGQIGENGLEPNIQYKLDSTYNFVKVE